MDVARRMQEDRLELIERLALTVHAGRCHRAVAMAALPPRDGTRWPVAWPDQPRLLRSPAGWKDVFLGERRYHYDHQTTLFTTAEMPVVSQITTASAEQPFFGVVVMIDPAEAGAITLDAAIASGPFIVHHGHGRPSPRSGSPRCSGATRAHARFPIRAGQLAPLIRREIVIRLLQGPQRDQVLAMAARSGSTDKRVGRAIERLRHDFDQPLGSMPAGDLGSVSSFHHHFKAVTAMSPLQFQKHLRLQEARRLLRSGDVDATAAAFRVGYDDTSHFSREYRRQFGEPPLRDVRRLRNEPVPTDRAAF